MKRLPVQSNLKVIMQRCWSSFPISVSSGLSRLKPFYARHIHTGFERHQHNDQELYEALPMDFRNHHNSKEVVAHYQSKSPTNVSLRMLMRWGEVDNGTRKNETRQSMLIPFASFLRREIPIRLAHRVRDLESMPVMREMKAVQEVKEIYMTSLLQMIQHRPIENNDDEQAFAVMLEELYSKHSSVLVQMANGAYELREAIRTGTVELPSEWSEERQSETTSEGHRETDNYRLLLHPSDVEKSNNNNDAAAAESFSDNSSLTGPLFEHMIECHAFLDRFYMSRIGIRVLAGQYLALRNQEQPKNYIGMICQTTSTYEIVRRAAADASGICRRKYGRAPQVNITGQLKLTFPYIPTYLHYILLELLKNALRATTELHRGKLLPPVTVVIADGRDNEDVVIKIADEGGGIRRSQIEKIWSYLYTTADSSLQEAYFLGKDHSNVSPIAGLGYGLPISRSYCQYFGGDIQLMSLEGFGTDIFIYLKRLGDSKEPLAV